MISDKDYVSTLEETIKRDLYPVYKKYYKDKGIQEPDLHAIIYQMLNSSTEAKVPALFKKK